MDQTQPVTKKSPEFITTVRERILNILFAEMSVRKFSSVTTLKGTFIYGMALGDIAPQVHPGCTTIVIADRCKSMGLVISRISSGHSIVIWTRALLDAAAAKLVEAK